MANEAPRKRRTIGPKLRASIYAKYGGRCAYCGKPVILKESKTYRMQVDHLVPFSKGGSDDFTNLNPACRTCNYWKADLDLEDFRHLCLAFREGAPYFTNRQRLWIKDHLFDIDRVLAGRRGKVIFAFERIAAGQKAQPQNLIPKDT